MSPRAGAGRSSRVSAPRSGAELLKYGARRFRRSRLVFGHGTSGAEEEAAYLLAHALKVRPADLPRVLGKTPSPRQRALALRLFERRVQERRPAAYLVHHAWLDEFRFYVDERAIVPRSHIAGLLREQLAPWLGEPGKVKSALDLCTGSGCLAILLAKHIPRAQVDAADISAAALEVARRNVRSYRLDGRVRPIESDLFAALRGRRYDLIVCNPPYVSAGSMRRLPREYRHEPRIALAGGRDGLDLVRRILRSVAAHLNPGGVLVMEVGSGRRRVERAFPRSEFVWPETAGGHTVLVATREQLKSTATAAKSDKKKIVSRLALQAQ